MPLFRNASFAVDNNIIPHTQNNKSHSVDYCDKLFAFCAAKAAGGSSVATYLREKTGATIYQGQTSGAEFEWNRGEKENQCIDSAEVGTIGGQQKTNNENMMRKFEGYKILVG